VSRVDQTLDEAQQFLAAAIAAIGERATQRDRPSGERSMSACVGAFNSIVGTSISERDGWLFMALLKASRSTGGAYHHDDYTDGAAYFALAGEAAMRAENLAEALQDTTPGSEG